MNLKIGKRLAGVDKRFNGLSQDSSLHVVQLSYMCSNIGNGANCVTLFAHRTVGALKKKIHQQVISDINQMLCLNLQESRVNHNNCAISLFVLGKEVPDKDNTRVLGNSYIAEDLEHKRVKVSFF